jgi:outer membrane lipoprotein-sorting protein
MNTSISRLTPVAVLMLLAVTVSAQVDQRANEILKSVSSKYKSYTSLQASFTLNRLDQKTKKTEKFDGNITLSGVRYQFSMADQTVICDGKTTWTFLKEVNEIQISDNKPAEGAITPTNIFTLYEKGFKSKFMGEKAIGKSTVQQIELTPEDTRKSYFKIVLTIDKTGKYVREARIFEKSGSITTYSIVKFTPNASLAADSFTFNKAKFPGAEIVDLR